MLLYTVTRDDSETPVKYRMRGRTVENESAAKADMLALGKAKTGLVMAFLTSGPRARKADVYMTNRHGTVHFLHRTDWKGMDHALKSAADADGLARHLAGVLAGTTDG